MIPVAEIFGPTIQGEGPNSGIKTIFLRVVGCDFKCAWCDSKFAWKPDGKTKYYDFNELAEELIKKCKETNTANVILTGGNPCLYNFEKIIKKLKDNNISVDVETQGSKLPLWLLELNNIIISPKAPSSKQPDVYETIKNWLEEQKPKNKIAIKIPIFNEEDFEFSKKYYDLVEDFRNKNINIELYLNVGNTNVYEEGDISKRILKDYEELIEKVMNCEMKRVYVMPQIHTLVWGNRSGV